VATLRIYVLGRPCVFWDQAPIQFPTTKAQDLLCFLLLHAGQTLERELIAEQLWPMRTSGKARHCLSTTLWRLRQTLKCLDHSTQPYLLTERSTLAFNTTAPYSFDVQVFERRAAFGLAGSLPCAEAHHQALEEAQELYGGDLLEGCYDDWCLAERERLQLLLLRVLKRLQRHCRLCGAFEAAISHGHRLLALDSLQEDVHRELMRCYVDAGQRSLAVEQFQRCRETLRRELQIEPMPETWQLFRRVRGSQEPASLRGTREDRCASLQAALAQFRRALDTLESTWYALQAVTAEFVETSESTQDGTVYPEHG
jgi:DNA-binding SARP family transcriptional activator